MKKLIEKVLDYNPTILTCILILISISIVVTIRYMFGNNERLNDGVHSIFAYFFIFAYPILLLSTKIMTEKEKHMVALLLLYVATTFISAMFILTDTEKVIMVLFGASIVIALITIVLFPVVALNSGEHEKGIHLISDKESEFKPDIEGLKCVFLTIIIVIFITYGSTVIFNKSQAI